jgi:hypothetical protein
MKYRSIALTIAAAASALFPTATFANVSVTVTGNSVSGFVDRSDVQTAFRFTDSAMQQYANSVVFNYWDHISVLYTCDWPSGTNSHSAPTSYDQEVDRTGTLNSYYNGSAKKFAAATLGTGWSVSGTLKMSGMLNGTNSIPQVGDSCTAGSGGQVITSVNVAYGSPTFTASIPSKGRAWLDTSGIVVE